MANSSLRSLEARWQNESSGTFLDPANQKRMVRSTKIPSCLVDRTKLPRSIVQRPGGFLPMIVARAAEDDLRGAWCDSTMALCLEQSV